MCIRFLEILDLLLQVAIKPERKMLVLRVQNALSAGGEGAANADRMFPDGETRRGLINFPLREAVAMKPRTMILLLVLASAATAQEEKPNFSGTWKFEPSPFAHDREVDKITHNDPDFAITEQVGRADVLYTLTFRTDGQPPKDPQKLSAIERTAHWEGKTLVINCSFLRSTDGSEKREEFSLSDDGKTMTKRVHFTGARPRPDQRVELKKVASGTGEIAAGNSEDVVRYQRGEPDSVERDENKTTFVYERGYDAYLIVFVDGKMTEERSRPAGKKQIP
jgi:hypothetical protein